MAADEWHNNGPQDLVTVSLCIQIAIDKMQLCLLSVVYACPTPPWSTLFTALTSANRSPTLCHLPGTVETGIHPSCQWPSKVNICPLKSIMTPNCSQVNTLVRTTSTQKNFPETVSDRLCRNSSIVQTHHFISCLVGCSQTIPQVKKPDVEVLGWQGYTWSAVGRTAKFSKITWQVWLGDMAKT